MAAVSVPVLKPLTYQGRSYVRGEMITLEAAVAAAKARAGEVSLAKGAQIARKDLKAEPTRRRGPRTGRGTYRRRDMVADPAGE